MLKTRSNMSKQTFVITPKNYPRPLDVLGEHAAVLASGAGEMIHRLKEDVRRWYELHRRNGATNVVVWAIYLELLLMLVLLVVLPFGTVQVGGRSYQQPLATLLRTEIARWVPLIKAASAFIS